MAIIGKHLTFGDSDGNVVTGSIIEDREITFGNGNGDGVMSSPINQPLRGSLIDHNKITFGNGNGDFVKGPSTDPDGLARLDHNKITFGNGNGDVVADTNIDHNQITFGDGSGDVMEVDRSLHDNKITFGNGNGDKVVQTNSHLVAVFGNTITLGNGQDDRVQLTQSFDDRIFLGNGNNDTITISNPRNFFAGQDTIWTGTGSSDVVKVVPHFNLPELADTFGFALGTTATSFTTISGAQGGDHLVTGIPGHASDLGDNPIQGATQATTMAAYISSLGTLTKGDTYVGYNQTANTTYVVTDTASGQTGDVQLVGVFAHNHTFNHVLTLG
jgi:hypothetical protein